VIVGSRRLAALALVAGAAVAACSSSGTATNAPSGSVAGSSAAAALTGKVTIDGSSTVYPITEAVAEEFQKANPNV
jgi:phosphate transport system substrate-binding protein